MYKTADGGLVGSHTPDSTLGELVSGPRWRMLSNKFGQDIPSLEIPAITCDAPPYEKGTVKYEVGDVVETTINLLDWSTKPENARWDDAVPPRWPTAPAGPPPGPPPTAADYVPGQMILDEDADRCVGGPTDDGTCVTSLGTKLTDGFDVAFYVKGDKKPLKVYDVFIRLEYEGGTVTLRDDSTSATPRRPTARQICPARSGRPTWARRSTVRPSRSHRWTAPATTPPARRRRGRRDPARGRVPARGGRDVGVTACR